MMVMFVIVYGDSGFPQITPKDVKMLMSVQNSHTIAHSFAPISMELMPVLAVKALKLRSMEFVD